MKIIYVNNVLGLNMLPYLLRKKCIMIHRNYLIDLINEGYLEDISDIFPTENDRLLFKHNESIIQYQGKLYTLPLVGNEKDIKLRTEEKSINIIEKYNSMLDKPMNFQYMEISENCYDKLHIIEHEDGSESVVIGK